MQPIMRFTSQLSRQAPEAAAACALLGPEHPLVLTSQRVTTLARQSLTVAVLLLTSTVAALAAVPDSLDFLSAAAVVQAMLMVGLIVHAQQRRAAARDLIVGGCSDLPLPVVERERRRLGRMAKQVAKSLRRIRAEVDRSASQLRSTRPLYHVRVVREVKDELGDIATALERDRPESRGIVMTERLLRDGMSCLYGTDADSLRRTLNRIRFFLAG
jgi:hypothetical protein